MNRLSIHRLTLLALPIAGFAVLAGVGARAGQVGDDLEADPIRYSATQPTDAVADLQAKIDSGRVKLAYDPTFGYLPAILKALDVPISSQTLVFSKSSFQRDLIAPKTPRAVYFNERVYVGYVQNAPVLEFSTTDPKIGAAFYTLSQEPDGKPKFVRQTHECLQCHASPMTKGVPGHVMRSMFVMPGGQPDFRSGSFLTSDQSPLQERWGGWYVSGAHGSQRHMGNSLHRSEGNPTLFDFDSGANKRTHTAAFDKSAYLSGASDIVALMVEGHFVNLHNLMTRLSFQTRTALQYERLLNKELGRPEDFHAESTDSRIRSAADPLVQSLLMSGEARLSEPVSGVTGFAGWFSARGPKDSQGRGLYQLDLRTRLLKYPCSPLIYSPEFAALPPRAKGYVLGKVRKALTSTAPIEGFQHLTSEDRLALHEILTATLPDYRDAAALGMN